MSTSNNDYSTFASQKGVTKAKSERSNSPVDDSSSEIQTTSLVLAQDQSVEPSQNGNHQPPKTRYIS